MNIKDFKAPDAPAELADIMSLIFDRQMELVVKYQQIEQLPTPPISLHTQNGNRIIRDFAWRTTEELAESFEAWHKHDDETVAEMHALEELADAMHFWVELCIYSGVTAAQLNDVPYGSPGNHVVDMEKLYWEVVFTLGIAMNFLRNKAWKTSQVPTDEARFRLALRHVHEAMLNLWSGLGYGPDALFAFYFKKSEVNKFRQRSNY